MGNSIVRGCDRTMIDIERDVSICGACGAFMEWRGDKPFPDKDWVCSKCGWPSFGVGYSDPVSKIDTIRVCDKT